MRSEPNPSLLIHQRHVIGAFATGLARSLLPRRKRELDDSPISQRVPAPAPRLQRAYAQWAHAHPDRYAHTVPWTLLADQIALPMIARLTARAPYPLLSVLNQSIRLQLHQPIPSTACIRLDGRLLEAADDGYRARIRSQISVGTDDIANCATLTACATVPLLRTRQKSPASSTDIPFRSIAQWQAAADEGRRFFYLTGDFNPIHTVQTLARLTRFRGCIMHGYGIFAQLFEALQNAGYAIADIEVKFIRPLPLPSPVVQFQIAQHADPKGRYAIRVIDDQQRLYQVGSLATTQANPA